MFSTLFQQVAGISSPRFTRNAFLPSLVFSAGLLAVVCASTSGISDAVTWWNDRSSTVQFALAAGGVIWTYLVANVVANQWRAIVRLFEGYWGPGHWLRNAAVSWHQARRADSLERLERAAQAHRNNEVDAENVIWDSIFYYEYPASTSTPLLPTRLGNILRAGESYPFDRYGVDGPVVWPRLFPLLPEKVVESTAQARADMEFSLVISFLAISFALLSFTLVLVLDANLWLGAGCYVGGLMIGWLGYRSSLAPATVYSEQTRACFDLYRFDLLDQLHLTRPISPAEEAALWAKVNALLFENTPQHWQFEPKQQST